MESLALVVALIVLVIIVAGILSAVALWRNPRHPVARIFFGAVAVFSVLAGGWLATATRSTGAWVIGGAVALAGLLSLWRLTRRTDRRNDTHA